MITLILMAQLAQPQYLECLQRTHGKVDYCLHSPVAYNHRSLNGDIERRRVTKAPTWGPRR